MSDGHSLSVYHHPETPRHKDVRWLASQLPARIQNSEGYCLMPDRDFHDMVNHVGCTLVPSKPQVGQFVHHDVMGNIDRDVARKLSMVPGLSYYNL